MWRFLTLHALMVPAAAPQLAQLRAAVPHAPVAGYGWWSWWDQSWYLEAALAWSHRDFDPALHWYPPAYPMLGALFTALTPTDPFMIPDLLCLVAALWLFAAISGRLLGAALPGCSIGAAVFVATTIWPTLVATAWVTPWTTTPETVGILACLLGTVRLAQRPSSGAAFLAGLGSAATLGIRPADAAIVGGVCAAASACALLQHWRGWRLAARVAAAAVTGAAMPGVLFGGAYLAINGPHLDGYLATSAAYGFEWRLLPLRWGLIMIDPKPLFAEGRGLAAVFPAILPGIAGMALAALRPNSVPRLAHVAVLAAVLGDLLVFVCYRDLHPDFLWRRGVYHYFKWMLPFFGLYCVVLARGLVLGPRRAPAFALAAVILGLAMWRVTIAEPAHLATATSAQTLALPHGLSAMDAVLFVRTAPNQTELAPFGSEIQMQHATFRSTYDFKLTPWSKTLMLQPLRPMPDALSTLVLPAGYYDLDPATAPVFARARLVWDLPCWIRPERTACRALFVLPPPDLPLGTQMRFGTGGGGEIYRATGLSPSEPGGDWTDGPTATIAFRLPEAAWREKLVLEVTAMGYVPAGGPIRVTASINGVDAGRWRFGPGPSVARTQLPPSARRPDGSVVLKLDIANPRSPASYGLSDMRSLGIQLQSMRVAAAE